MPCFLVEIWCPEHGLERFKIKIVRKYNVKSSRIIPKFRRKPRPELSSLIIGRDVKEAEVRNYLIRYFRETGMIETIISMRLMR